MLNLFLSIYDFVCLANIALFIILVIEIADGLKNKYPECNNIFTHSLAEFIGAIFTITLLAICPIIHLYVFYLLTTKANWIQEKTIKNIENKYNLGEKDDEME